MTMLPIANADPGAVQREFAVNLMGSFNTMQQAANRLRDGGRIINFSTSAIALALPGYGPYTATKAAVEMLTRRSEEHTSELQSLMRTSYAVFCLKKKTIYS